MEFAALLGVLVGAAEGVLTMEVARPVVVADVGEALVTGGAPVGAPVVEFVVPVVGGGTALLGSVSAPVPQGIAAPPGCVAFVGGVVAPESDAMAKRPVQVVFAAAGAVNW